MLTTGVSGVVALFSGSASVRSLVKPATFGGAPSARGSVRKVTQTVQFVGAPEGGMDEILPRFGLAISISQNTAARGHNDPQRRARAVRRDQHRHQNQNGEKYAACWMNAENRQH